MLNFSEYISIMLTCEINIKSFAFHIIAVGGNGTLHKQIWQIADLLKAQPQPPEGKFHVDTPKLMVSVKHNVKPFER